MTLSSFLTLLGFFDLGIGNGLINAVSETHGRGDDDGLREAVSIAFYLLILDWFDPLNYSPHHKIMPSQN